MIRLRIHWVVFLVCLAALPDVRAQIDPVKRRLLQLGYNQPLEGRSPIAGYAFYYLNEPGLIQTNLTLRLALAPVYLDAELGAAHALGPNTDLGIGIAGGGFADSYSEIRQGNWLREESFAGHGAEVSANVYHLFNPGDRLPLYGIVRAAGRQSLYERDSTTAPGFVIPGDKGTLHTRMGLRLGGKEPMIQPALAMELSVWYEGQLRSDPAFYGYGQDRSIEDVSHLFWTRALWAYTLPESKHNFSVTITAGTSLDADRLSGYRLGGFLPMTSEFPLDLPGYYFQELSAERFVLLGGQYTLPLDPAKCWTLTAFSGTSWVDYLRGLEQPGCWNSGVGGGVGYQPRSKSWQIMAGYAYGIDAIRSHGTGSHVVGVLCQIDLSATTAPDGSRAHMNPNKFRGLNWLLGR
jgi:hypothetical protein